MKKIKLLFPILLFTLTSFSQESPTEIAKTFFTDFEKEGISIAIDNLYISNKWINRSSDAIVQLKSQMEGLNKDFVGEYYGKELILEKKLSDSFVLLSYMVKYDRQPIRFVFQFYKPNNIWRIQSFSFDGNIDEEIEEAAKLYNFRLN